MIKPKCPKCEDNLLVRRCQRNGIWGWHCWKCGEIFIEKFVKEGGDEK